MLNIGISGKFIIPTEEELRDLYITQNKTRAYICNYYHFGKTTLDKLLSKYSLKKPRIPHSKEELERLYIKENKSKQELQDYYKVNKHTLDNWLVSCGVKKPSIKKPSKQELYKLYIEQNLTRNAICKMYNFSIPFLTRVLKEYAIKKEKSNPSKEDILNLYIVQNKPAIETAKILGISLAKLISLNKKYQITKDIKLVVKNRENTFNKTTGYSSPFKNPKIQEKIRQKHIKDNGVPYVSQSKMPKESFDILNNKEKLEKVIKDQHSKTFKMVGKALNVDETTVARYVHIHNLEYLIDSKTSTPEQEIKELLKEILLRKDREILEGQEIDLYSNEHKIGIEFNGNYWHTDNLVGKYYHINKSKIAESKSVFIFHIFEHEWNDKRKRLIIESQLKNLFNLNTNKIYARNCEIREVPSNEASKFLNENHIQGSSPSQVRLGLYYNNELVSLMEFITNGINKNYSYELSRFCSKVQYSVVGGASKLFKHFLKVYNPKSVISYSDIAKTTGKLYETLGFTLDHISKPQYHWTNGHVTLSRYQTQLKQLRKYGWLKEGETKSESQVMRERGFNKIYDCGKKVWTLFR